MIHMLGVGGPAYEGPPIDDWLVGVDKKVGVHCIGSPCMVSPVPGAVDGRRRFDMSGISGCQCDPIASVTVGK